MRRTIRLLIAATLFLSITSGISNKGICTGLRHKKDSLRRFSVTLGAQSNSGTGSLLDLSDARVLQLAEGRERQKAADILYAYGRNTKANLLAPSSGRVKLFGRSLNKMSYTWSDFSKGYFINIKHGKKARKLYTDVQTQAQLIDAYNLAEKMVKGFEGYKKEINGPAISIRHIAPGDVIIFRSYDKRGLYAIAKVVDYKSGYKGAITLDLKVTVD